MRNWFSQEVIWSISYFFIDDYLEIFFFSKLFSFLIPKHKKERKKHKTQKLIWKWECWCFYVTGPVTAWIGRLPVLAFFNSCYGWTMEDLGINRHRPSKINPTWWPGHEPNPNLWIWVRQIWIWASMDRPKSDRENMIRVWVWVCDLNNPKLTLFILITIFIIKFYNHPYKKYLQNCYY